MKKIFFAIITTATALFAGCNHKDLCYHHPHSANVRVEFDWSNAPEANPEGMSVWFYSKTYGNVQRFDFAGREGGTVEILVGEYEVLCFNNDTEAVLFRGSDAYNQHEAYTRKGDILESLYGNSGGQSRAPRAEGTEAQDVVISPDELWGSGVTNVVVTDYGLSYTCSPYTGDGQAASVESEEYVITLCPEERYCIYTYEIRDIENLEHAVQMCGTISGMANSAYIADGSLGRDPVIIPFASNIGEEDVTGRFLTFGHHEENVEPHKFVLYVWMKDGSKWYYTFDVTDQVHNAPNKRRVHIVIDNLELPTPIGGGEGFDITVDDWINEDVEIQM